MSKTRRQPDRHAFSLIESVIVLALIGLVIGGVWAASNSLMKNITVNRTIAGMVQIISNVRAMYARSSETATVALANPTGMEMGIFRGADGYVLSPGGSRIASPLRGTGTIVFVNYYPQSFTLPSGRVADNVIRLQYGGRIRQEDCVSFVAGVTSRFSANGSLMEFASTSSPAAVTTFPYIPTASECNPGATMNFYFSF